MPRFLIFEDVVETRKYVVEAADEIAAVTTLEAVQEAGDQGSFVTASTVSLEVHRLDEHGEIVASFPPARVA